MSKEGIPTIIIVLCFAAMLIVLGNSYENSVVTIFGGLFLAFGLFSVYFFRDPKRTAPDDPDCIISPADGRVLDVTEVDEPLFINGKAMRVAIFMSVFDVHVNYTPFQGTVEFVKYNRGKFLPANLPEASIKNVSTFVGLETPYGKLAFKQSTGLIARRIVCRLIPGQEVKTGEKFGIIKFGSRMEVFLEDWAKVTVKKGDRLHAGESVIAKINEKETIS